MDVQALWLAIDDEENAEDDTENDYLDIAGLIVGIAVITAEEQRCSDNAVQNAAEKHGSTLYAEIYSPILVREHHGRLCTQDASGVY